MHVKPDIAPGGLANLQNGVTVKPDIVEGLKWFWACFNRLSRRWQKYRETGHSWAMAPKIGADLFPGNYEQFEVVV
jgi:hypothetical protein